MGFVIFSSDIAQWRSVVLRHSSWDKQQRMNPGKWRWSHEDIMFSHEGDIKGFTITMLITTGSTTRTLVPCYVIAFIDCHFLVLGFVCLCKNVIPKGQLEDSSSCPQHAKHMSVKCHKAGPSMGQSEPGILDQGCLGPEAGKCILIGWPWLIRLLSGQLFCITLVDYIYSVTLEFYMKYVLWLSWLGETLWLTTSVSLITILESYFLSTPVTDACVSAPQHRHKPHYCGAMLLCLPQLTEWLKGCQNTITFP